MSRLLVLCLLLFPIVASFPQNVFIKDGKVGASFGGYSASAGLGGAVGGSGPRGGLHAEAGTPDGHYAAAGLGGSVSEGGGPQGGLYSRAGHSGPQGGVQLVAPVAPQGSNAAASSASSSASSYGGTQNVGGVQPVVYKTRPSSFFDDIFNIPISTLGAVNQYLNNRHRGVVYTQGKQSESSASSSSSASSASSSATSGTAQGIDNTIYHGYQKPQPNYDNIFNIPISVLGAVNKFLNGK